ncbi:MAG TPA: DUF4386 domain-containing protein [Microlunatus sp.]
MNNDTVVHSNLDSGSMRRASLTAGLALALMVVIAPFGVFGAIGALVTPGDAARTAQDILGSESLFRWGIASLILVVILDIVVAAALLRLFEPVDRNVSIMAAWSRVAYAAVYLVAIVQLVIALELLDDPAQALRAVNAYDTTWHVGLILFGFHLLLIGYLAYRSGFMPKIFGILLVLAGLGYLTDGFVLVLVPDPSISIGSFTFLGEVALIFWLLIVGRRKDFGVRNADRTDHRAPDSLITTPVG